MQWFPDLSNSFFCRFRRRNICAIFCAHILLLSAVALVCPRVAAQAQNSGTVTGRIKDTQGRIIADATITLTSQSQGRVVTVKTNTQGEYVFNSVPVADYTLTVVAPTFAEYVVGQLSVNAAESVSVDAVLQPASEAVNVTVTAGSAAIDTHSATVGITIDNKLVENLPLDGNNAVQLAALLPGVTDVNAPTTFTSNVGGPTYNVSGARNNQNLLLLDGAIWNNLYNNTGLNFPTPRALQEVSVILNNYKAQYGRNAGSVFNALTRAGTNSLHGVIWENVQNKAFNAADYLSHTNPALVQNQFGATLGGPVMRNKLFFFLAYQDLRSAAAVTAQAQTFTLNERGLTAPEVPRTCITSAFAAYTCATFTEDGSTTFVNPVLGNSAASAISALNAAWQVAGNSGTSPCVTLLQSQPAKISEVPSICFNPVTAAIGNRLPLPNVFGQGGTLPIAVSEAKQPRFDHAGLIRIDWNTGRHAIDARYYQTAANDLTANGVSAGQGVANYEINRNIAALHFGNMGDTWVLSDNLLNVARIAYKRYQYQISATDHTDLKALGGKLVQPGEPTLPLVEISGRTLNVGTLHANTSYNVDEDIEFDDSLSWSHGKHNIQAGVEFLRLQYVTRYDESPRLEYASYYTGVPAADFIMGLVSSTTFGNGTNENAIQYDLYSYIQDDWRITPKLTLNLGLRYELPFPWHQPQGYAATFIPGYQSVMYPTAPTDLAFVGDPGISRSLISTQYNNLAPRFGFAYDVFGNGNTSIRGGFGIFYDAINALVVGVSEPYHFQATYTANPGGTSDPLLGLSAIPADYVKGQPPQFVTPYSIMFPDANFTTPYSEAINFGIQQKIRGSSTLEVDYVARMSRHLPLGYDLNPTIYDCSGGYFQQNPSVYCTDAAASQDSYKQRVKYANFNYGGSGVLDYMTAGSASYNALQFIYSMRSSRHLTTTASYTYSKSLDNSSTTGIKNSTDQPSLGVHRALSDFNATHILNIGFVYQFPTLAGAARPVRTVFGGWSASGIYNARTGHPFSATTSADTTLRDEPAEYLNFVPGVNPMLPSNRHRTQKVQEWFNVSGVALAPAGTFGNIPRNFFIGPSFINTTLSLQRTFKLMHDRNKSFSFRADAINAFNTPNLGLPSALLSNNVTKNGSFGVILATVGNNGTVGTNGRRFQFSGTIRF